MLQARVSIPIIYGTPHDVWNVAPNFELRGFVSLLYARYSLRETSQHVIP